MDLAATQVLTLQRVKVFGSPHLTHIAISTRQLNPWLQGLSALTPNSNVNRKFVTVKPSLVDSCKSFNISTAMDSSINTSGFIVTSASVKSNFGSPRADLHLDSHGFSRGLASAVLRDSESVPSTSDSSAHQAEDSRPIDEKKTSSQRLGFFATGAGILSTIF